ncbi:flagellar protein FlaG [Cytobacillus horneckiae]|nr:flagellar protein FlaG [Cytobacillus horneckiae]MCM3178969.1 flagellar protein FlaG [Cytobacillus horneckiae]MEC1154185.1 flagellar protein FlaG [Cytobacillus horneckiae]MED2936270.1 flagellar protein FlaG [Cytobacillus horneckiae]
MRVESEVLMKPISSSLFKAERSEKGQDLEVSVKAVSETEYASKKDFLQSKIDEVNIHFEPSYTSVQFQLHEDLNRYYVEVVDSMTKEVVREIPPKDFLDMIAKMTEFQGLIIDKKA